METSKKALVWFFVLTFLLSWAIWVPALTSTLGWPGYEVPGYGLVGAIMPGIAALIVAAFTGRRKAVGALFGQLRVWRMGLSWYAIAILLRPAMVVGVFIACSLWKGSPLPAADFSIIALIVMLLVQTPNTLLEEVGWRGYALPRLAATHGWLKASLLLGVIWATWHFPYWATSPSIHVYGLLGIASFSAMVIVGSVLFAWVYMRTGSVLLTWLLHLSTNTALAFLPLSSEELGTLWPLAIDTMLVGVIALVVARSMMGSGSTLGSAKPTVSAGQAVSQVR